MCPRACSVGWPRVPGSCVGRRSLSGQPARTGAHTHSSMCDGRLIGSPCHDLGLENFACAQCCKVGKLPLKRTAPDGIGRPCTQPTWDCTSVCLQWMDESFRLASGHVWRARCVGFLERNAH